MLKPFLKYAGGKRWLVPSLERIWTLQLSSTPDLRLVEPFVGGMSVSLGLGPKKAILSDINPHLINLYKSVAKGAFSLPLEEYQHDRDWYFALRERFNSLVRSELDIESCNFERARLFYMLNRTCFNGLTRFSLKGKFNVPFGNYPRVEFLSPNQFSAYQDRFTDWDFSCGDFQSIKLASSDFLYLDPPYHSDGDKAFTGYFGKFDWNDRVRMVKWAASANIPVVASDLATSETMGLYSDHGFKLTTVVAPRRISANGNRESTIELLCHKNIKDI